MVSSHSNSSLKLPEDHDLAQQIIQNDSEKHKRELGSLGIFFGSSENAPTNIIGLLTVVFVLSAFVYTCIPDNVKSFPTYQFWSLILPVISTMVGYCFGSKRK